MRFINRRFPRLLPCALIAWLWTPAAFAGITPTTFNPSDTSAGITLSNGNLTETLSNNAAATYSRSIAGFSGTGKYYFELTMSSSNVVAIWVGLGGGSETAANFTNNCTGTAACLAANGDLFVNASNKIGINGNTNWVNGGTLEFAVDFGNAAMWVRNGPSSEWNNSATANPATNTGGISLSTLSGSLFIMVGHVSGAGDGVHTVLNAGQNSFLGTVPSGFSSGFGSSTSSSLLLIGVGQ